MKQRKDIQNNNKKYKKKYKKMRRMQQGVGVDGGGRGQGGDKS